MRVTLRLALLAAAGAIPLFLVNRAPWLLGVVLLYDFILAAVTVADLVATPRPGDILTIERNVDGKLSLGGPNIVTIVGRSRAPWPIHAEVRDDPPHRFDLDGETTQRLELPAGNAPASFSYHVIPRSKGDFEFGDMFVRYKGRLGLIERIGLIPARQEVRVYPNLIEMAKYEMLARRGRLMQVGIRSARLRGGGAEFESLREYVPGDEYRKIDWSATARRGKLITRQYEVERSQNIVLMLDSGRTMLQPIQKMAKLDYVVNTALMLAYVAASTDDKVGVMAFDADIRFYIQPGKGRAQVFRIMEHLYNLDARLVETDYQEAFESLAARWRRRSLIVLFTDLIDPDSSAQIVNTIPMLEERHRVICVTVSDPNVLGAASEVPETALGVHRKAVAIQVLHERRQAINALKRRGVWTIDSPPEKLSADLINHYLDLKERSLI
jgi:uncharacterized protein (DUF58 family)